MELCIAVCKCLGMTTVEEIMEQFLMLAPMQLQMQSRAELMTPVP